MTEKQRAQRNLKPHAEALAAMWLFGREYSEQRGGSMDFWDGLSESRKRVCKEMVEEILKTKARA